MKKRNIRKKIILFLSAFAIVLLSLGFNHFNDRDFKIAKNLEIFFALFRELNLFYVDDTDPEKLIKSSIDGMLKSLDPYTSFIPESEMDDFAFMTTGEYGGIGALIRRAGKMTIISEPYKGFPAYKAGLKAGDTIVSVDGKLTANKSVSEVSEMLKGTPNTSLKVRINRYGTPEIIEKTLVREKITIKNVPYYGVLDDKIGYIKLSNFTKDAGKEVKEALTNLKKQNISSVILDLRSNPGGLLVESVNVANVFLGKKNEVVSTRGKVKQWDNTYETKENPIDTIIPVIVLVDRGSASASEIVAGAIQDMDRGVIVGQRTFGKGLVQTTRPLSYNTQLKVTTAKYYIPSGRCIQALDYTHRNEDGSVGYIPDSLISQFKTRNGRKVYDGGGISPDISSDDIAPSQITISLFTKNLIFDYATVFAANNSSISPIESYYISDYEYNEFVEFLKEKDFDYTTNSEKKLEELIKTARLEKYYDLAREQFDALSNRLAHDKNKDLQNFKDEIKDLLTEEIASRYYYQEGRIRASLKNDIQLNKAVEILGNKEQYYSLLKPDESKESKQARMN